MRRRLLPGSRGPKCLCFVPIKDINFWTNGITMEQRLWRSIEIVCLFVCLFFRLFLCLLSCWLVVGLFVCLLLRFSYNNSMLVLKFRFKSSVFQCCHILPSTFHALPWPALINLDFYIFRGEHTHALSIL